MPPNGCRSLTCPFCLPCLRSTPPNPRNPPPAPCPPTPSPSQLSLWEIILRVELLYRRRVEDDSDVLDPPVELPPPNGEAWDSRGRLLHLPQEGGQVGKEQAGRDAAHAGREFDVGIFDETGIFLALCCHGFVLVLADMIRSGELMEGKVPLAIVKELLDVFEMDLGAGYDVGCHFGATVENSDLGDLVREKNLKCLVGSFHGHAHNRLCQLRFLATFHWQQEIATYVKHFDSFETYANLSKFLCNNYRQALTILKTEPMLMTWMLQEGIHSCEEFHQWLEEKTYLLGLKDAPKTNVETLEMEYVQKLVNLSASHVVAAEARQARSDDAAYAPGMPKAELARRHATEKVEKDLENMQELERVLEIVERWMTMSIKKRKYQLALDALELLIVERIFELTKMNQSQTGYKMHKHIAKALQARSKAVRNAIDRYNAAASILDPPMPPLTWDQVVEYAFLADFDILRDTRAEDCYFKILRAKEEIKRLNVEIPRVVTWIRDEDRFLRRMERGLRETEGSPRRRSSGHSDGGTGATVLGIGEEARFTASLRPGISVERRAAQEALREAWEAAREAGAENEMAVDETVVVDAEMSTLQGPEVDEGWEDVDAEEDARIVGYARARRRSRTMRTRETRPKRSGIGVAVPHLNGRSRWRGAGEQG
ncbi:hypothetical protein B0H14DRAFT_2587320 [Mycena olivaceomarginata]|nr:hypothetical protein B0H14DRAFT_2587320 [Mycena olivaceomarginata]